MFQAFGGAIRMLIGPQQMTLGNRKRDMKATLFFSQRKS